MCIRDRDKAIQIRDAARTSIGSVMPAKFLELKQTIKLIRELTSEIDEIEVSIQKIMDELNPPILSIPGVGIQSAAMILAEIGDFSNFEDVYKRQRCFWHLLCEFDEKVLDFSSLERPQNPSSFPVVPD